MLCLYVCGMSDAHRGQKGETALPRLELQMVVSLHLQMGVVGMRLGPLHV